MAISEGVPAPEREAVVLVSNAALAHRCTGAVIAPGVVLTSKHCADDGTGAAVEATAMRVYVGPSLAELVAEHGVAEVAVATGSWAVDGGADVALLRLEEAAAVAPLELSFAPAAGWLGDRVVAVGYGETSSGSSGVKMEVETTVTDVDYGLVHVEPSICLGDSGGPMIGPDGRVGALASFLVGSGDTTTCGFPGGYTSLEGFADFVADTLAPWGACARAGEETCNGYDDDCDGVIDPGCTPVGQPCASDRDCQSSLCEAVDGALVCTEPCDPLEPVDRCPAGTYCAPVGACEGRCAPGEPGSDACCEPADCPGCVPPPEAPVGGGCAVSAAGASPGSVPAGWALLLVAIPFVARRRGPAARAQRRS
ncbi:MAG: trypsin-like serine protease [Myxococcota bacterium]